MNYAKKETSFKELEIKIADKKMCIEKRLTNFVKEEIHLAVEEIKVHHEVIHPVEKMAKDSALLIRNSLFKTLFFAVCFS